MSQFCGQSMKMENTKAARCFPSVRKHWSCSEGWRTFSSFGKLLLASSYVPINLYVCHGLDDLKGLIQPKWFYIYTYTADGSEALTDPAHTPRWLSKKHLSTAWCQTLVWLQWAIFLSTYMVWCIWDNMETSRTWDMYYVTYTGLLQARDFAHAFAYGWPKKIQEFLAGSIGSGGLMCGGSD